MDGAVRPRHKGFSLAEYLFALGLLAVVALTLLGVFARGNQLIQKSGEVSTADELASSIIEDIKMSVSEEGIGCLLYTSPSPRDLSTSRMPSSA